MSYFIFLTLKKKCVLPIGEDAKLGWAYSPIAPSDLNLAQTDVFARVFICYSILSNEKKTLDTFFPNKNNFATAWVPAWHNLTVRFYFLYKV